MNSPSNLTLGVDFGLRYLGFALAYSADLIVPIKGVDTKREGNPVLVTLDILKDYPISRVVVGCPGIAANVEHELKPFVEAFAELLAKECGLKVSLWDEALTSFEASSILRDLSRGRSAKKKEAAKTKEHALAAASILKAYFASSGPA
ncbi:MAG: Holliday junction resolvase RuvX [Nitrospirota bacterium]|nr:Holliday junction resolvase RuvX [Nitrospirota bacterium]